MATETESPEDAASAAAYEELENTDWPPKKADVQRIAGAAGGAAAGAGCIAAGSISGGVTALASPLCSAIGKIIGEYIAGAIYDIFDGLFADEYVAPQYDYVIAKRLRGAAARLAQLRWGRPGTKADIAAEARLLEESGVPGATLITLHDGAGAYGNERGPWLPYYSESGLDSYLANLATVEGSIASGIIVKRELGGGRKTSLAKVAVIGGGIGLLLWVLKSRLL